MKISAKKGQLQDQAADLLVINQFQVASIDKLLSKNLTTLIKEEAFKAKLGQSFLINTFGKIPAKRVLVVGLGKSKNLNSEKIRRASSTALKIAKKHKAKTIVSTLHGSSENFDPQESAYAIATGSLLADYSFTNYQKSKAKLEKKHAIKSLTLVDHSQQKVNQANQGIDKALKTAPGVYLARDLVNEPGLKVTPSYLANTAKKIASASPQISLKVFDENQLKKMGAGALLAVSRGSAEPAYLIHLTYKPKNPTKKIALLGKGLTFDTGGYSLKPSEFMNIMKIDMGGAATVFGIFQVISQLNPQVEVHGIVPTSENLISGRAIKPGDIVTALNGKTIEILNTDAEGRLILADALSYIHNQKWDYVLDFATLTGACIVALGEKIAGLFSNNQKLTKQIIKASKKEGETFWPLPLVADYKDQIKSQIADLQNISKSRYGGAVTAALFLQEFIPPKTPWAHLDIAGPAYEEKNTIAYLPQGGTGFAVRSILRFLQNL